VIEVDRRRFLLAVLAAGGVGAIGVTSTTGCAPKPTLADARSSLIGLWDAIVPGTHNGVVEDRLADGRPAPGATDAGVMEWMESGVGTLPPPLDYITDWFLRAWAADLDLWADTFHPPFEGAPTFGALPLGPTFAERGRQYKIMLMQGLFDGILDLKYFGAVTLAKLAFYCDFRSYTQGTPRVGGPYIGFPGAVGTAVNPNFTYARPFGTADARLTATPGGLVAVP